VLALLAPAARGVDLRSGFETRTLAGGIRQAIDVSWAPDGRMFVASKLGRVYRVDSPGDEPHNVIDISSHVNVYGDRGLEGIAVDSDFAHNRYLWLLYVYEPHESQREDAGPRTARLTRVTVRSNGTAGNEKVVLGKSNRRRCPKPGNSSDCIPADNLSHTVGTVRSAGDGTLFVGNGDGGDENILDPRSLRAYDVRSYAGKILHVDRRGRGLPGHPFCRGHDDLKGVCTKVYARGLRNPYRFTFRPGGGLIVGDVGWGTREELDFVAPGRNYGWPCYEGGAGTGRGAKTDQWRDRSECQGVYSRGGTKPPFYDYLHHGDTAAIIGGPRFPGGAGYPGSYRGEIFFGDFTRGTIRTVDPDTRKATAFASGVGVVDLELGPNGRVVYVDIGDEAVREIVAVDARASRR
jgi:glucose/arabinose dehydrogenase